MHCVSPSFRTGRAFYSHIALSLPQTDRYSSRIVRKLHRPDIKSFIQCINRMEGESQCTAKLWFSSGCLLQKSCECRIQPKLGSNSGLKKVSVYHTNTG